MEKEAAFYLHPITIHFPIAFYALELVFLLIWKWKKDEQFLRFARLVFRFAYGLMILSMAAGWRDAGGVEGITGGVKAHFLAAISLAVFSSVRLVIWQLSKEKPRSGLLIATAVLGNFLVVLTGFLGGKLVYE